MYEPVVFSNRMNWLRRQMGDLLDAFGMQPGAPAWSDQTVFPALNIWEEGDTVCVEAEMPGLSIGDVEITVLGNELTLQGARKAPKADNLTFHRRERTFGTFHRTLRLPVDIDAAKVEAELKNGVLALRLPKAASAKPRKINVKVTGNK